MPSTSTITYPELAAELALVIANLDEREWIQGQMVLGESVCAHGAVQTCQALRPGDEHIICAVMRTSGVTEDWSDEDLAETFGPSWALVIAVIRRAATLTEEKATQLDAAWAAAWAAARDAARDAAWAAAVMDLVGQHGLTQQHIDTLMKPWVTVLGADWATTTTEGN